MGRVVLVHWKPAEAPPLIENLRAAGFEAELSPPPGAPAWKSLAAAPPDAFVIDLDCLPSHGRAVGIALRQRKATRTVPLVFAGGLPDKVERTRQELPDAHYCEWARVGTALRKAMRRAPPAPIVPSGLGYSGTPLPKKLGIRAGCVVALIGAPPRFERKLDPLPESVRLTSRCSAADVVLLFAATSAEMATRFDAAADAVVEGGKLWIIWPKKASGARTDLTQPAVRKFGMDAGWVDYKIAAVDETWSGLLFARRR